MIKRNYQNIVQALNKFNLLNYFYSEVYRTRHDSYDPYAIRSVHDVLSLNYLFLLGVMWFQGYVFDYFDNNDCACMHELIALKLIAVKQFDKWVDVPHPESYCECYLTPIGVAYIRSIGLDKSLDNAFDKPYSYKPPIIPLPDKSTKPKLSKFQMHYGLFKSLIYTCEAIIFFMLIFLTQSGSFFLISFPGCLVTVIGSFMMMNHFDDRPKLKHWEANYPYPFHALEWPLDSDSPMMRLHTRQLGLADNDNFILALKKFAYHHSNETRISILEVLYRYHMLSHIKRVNYVLDAMEYHMFLNQDWADIHMWVPFLID